MGGKRYEREKDRKDREGKEGRGRIESESKARPSTENRRDKSKDREIQI